MTKARVEVNQEGELYIVLPVDIVEELAIEEGDVAWITEQDGEVILTF